MRASSVAPCRLIILGLIPLLACAASESRTDAGADSGAMPDAGSIAGRVPMNHRPSAMTCDHMRPSEVPDGGFDASTAACTSDSDCVDGGLEGRCVLSSASSSPSCNYDECFTDSDCRDGGVCGCRDPALGGANTCLPSNCRVDADCGDGGYCSPMPGGCAPYTGTIGYFCHTPKDQCLDDSDCPAGFSCLFDAQLGSKWLCAPLDCSG